MGGPKSYKSKAKVKLQSGLVLLLLALVKLGGTKVIQKSGRSQAAVRISITVTHFSQAWGDQSQAAVKDIVCKLGRYIDYIQGSGSTNTT